MDEKLKPDLSKLKVFAKMNTKNGEVCPICGEEENGAVVLIPIHETQNGNIAEAKQVHLACLVESVLYYPPEKGMSHNGHMIGVCIFPDNKNYVEKI